MSNKAMNWAWEQPIDNSGAKFVLVALADHASDHAGEDWTCFPSNERLQAFTSQPSRTLERNIGWLVAEGYISRETPRGKRGRVQVRHYRLHRDDAVRAALKAERAGGVEAVDEPQDSASPPANMAGGEGSDHPPKEAITTRQNGGAQPANMAGGYIAEPPKNPQEPPLSAGAREVGFALAWDYYPDAGRRGVSSPRMGREAWDAEVANGADPVALARAVRRYAADRAAWGASGRPAAFHRFLAEGRWEAFAGAPPSGLAAALAESEAGFADPDVWNAVVAAEGEPFAAAYLVPARWDGERRSVITRTTIAAERLRRSVGSALKALGVSIEHAGSGR